jgi:phosphonate degradation associated HDIG domain protein
VSVVDEIFARFQTSGDELYIGEPVTVSEHMLQAAAFAQRDEASAELVAAALLHDYGHLVHDLPEDSAEHGVDTRHEELGFAFLERSFPPEVTEPIRLHVAAKRYLVAIDPAYRGALSPASLRSLDLQGGRMSTEEVVAFESGPHSEAACRLRRWDDAGKVPGLAVPPLESYRSLLESLVEPVRARVEQLRDCGEERRGSF